MNRTLLVEEGDDEVANRQDKKKREKEKFVESAGTLQDSVYCLTKSLQYHVIVYAQPFTP